MKKLSCVLLMGLLATGCEKKKEQPRDVGGIPGGGTTVITQYAGTVVSDKQDVPVNADVINYPQDGVYAYLCKNAVCDAKALPAEQCQTAAPGVACYRTTPAVNFVYGVNLVRLLYGTANGYTSYAIETVVTR